MVVSGKPTHSACANNNCLRTPCMATRSNAWLRVVNSPTTSMAGSWRRRCKAQALSFPLLQESSTFFFVMISPATCRTVLQDSVANCAIYIAGHKSIPSWVSVSPQHTGENN